MQRCGGGGITSTRSMLRGGGGGITSTSSMIKTQEGLASRKHTDRQCRQYPAQLICRKTKWRMSTKLAVARWKAHGSTMLTWRHYPAQRNAGRPSDECHHKSSRVETSTYNSRKVVNPRLRRKLHLHSQGRKVAESSLSKTAKVANAVHSHGTKFAKMYYMESWICTYAYIVWVFVFSFVRLFVCLLYGRVLVCLFVCVC